MRFAIFGLSGSGKTTLFNVLTGRHEEKGFATSKHVAVVPIPDPRLDAIFEKTGSKKKTPVHLEYVDVIIVGDRRTESNFASIRPADAVVNVVRAFESEEVPAPEGIDPERDIKEVEQDFIIMDLAQVETRMEKIKRERSKRKDPELEKEMQVLQKVKDFLDQEKPLRELELSPEEEVLIRGYEFLSAKPVVHVINADENNFSQWREKVKSLPAGEKSGYVVINAKIEEEIMGLEQEEAEEFMKLYGIEKPAVEEFLLKSFEVLDLIIFYTTNERETRAWPLKKGSTAYEAAGKVHTDIQRGFIRAEVVDWRTFVEAGSWAELRKQGKIRVEGKSYVVQDGDVLFFRFNP